MYRGIALAGGGAMLRGLDRRLVGDAFRLRRRGPADVSSRAAANLEEAKMLQKVQASLATRKPLDHAPHALRQSPVTDHRIIQPVQIGAPA
jgi:hypothetical protein